MLIQVVYLMTLEIYFGGVVLEDWKKWDARLNFSSSTWFWWVSITSHQQETTRTWKGVMVIDCNSDYISNLVPFRWFTFLQPLMNVVIIIIFGRKILVSDPKGQGRGQATCLLLIVSSSWVVLCTTGDPRSRLGSRDVGRLDGCIELFLALYSMGEVRSNERLRVWTEREEKNQRKYNCEERRRGGKNTIDISNPCQTQCLVAPP